MTWLFSVSLVHAATLSLSGVDMEHNLGDTVVVTIEVNTDVNINGIQANIQWPAELLRLESIETEGSLMDFWVVEPEQRKNNQVSFEGVILNPGYNGIGGEALRLIFKAKAQGEGAIDFLSAAVLANDGIGTNVLTEAVPAPFRVSRAATPVVITSDQTGDQTDELSVVETVFSTTTLEEYVVTNTSENTTCEIKNDGVVLCTETITVETPEETEIAEFGDSHTMPQSSVVKTWCQKISCWWWILLAFICLLCGWTFGRMTVLKNGW